MFKLQLSLENLKDKNYDLFFPLSFTMVAAGRKQSIFLTEDFRSDTVWQQHSWPFPKPCFAGLMLVRSPSRLRGKKTQPKICKYKTKWKPCTKAKNPQASKPPMTGKCHCCSSEISLQQLDHEKIVRNWWWQSSGGMTSAVSPSFDPAHILGTSFPLTCRWIPCLK